MKAIWKGYLKVSLVTIPVRLYHALAPKVLSFELLHKDCGTKIIQQRYCPHCQKVLAAEELIRGYRYGKDLYITVTDEELERARAAASQVMEILQFVDEREIHPLYYADAHYLVPDGQAGTEAFALLHRALIETKRAALAKGVLRQRQHLFAIRPYQGALIAFTLHYPEEIVAVERLEEAAEVLKVPVEAKGLALARTLVEALAGPFTPEKYPDEYTQSVLSLIQAKAAGEEYRVAARPEPEKVINLMEALARSVAAAKGEGRKAAGTRAPRKVKGGS